MQVVFFFFHTEIFIQVKKFRQKFLFSVFFSTDRSHSLCFFFNTHAEVYIHSVFVFFHVWLFFSCVKNKSNYFLALNGKQQKKVFLLSFKQKKKLVRCLFIFLEKVSEKKLKKRGELGSAFLLWLENNKTFAKLE